MLPVHTHYPEPSSYSYMVDQPPKEKDPTSRTTFVEMITNIGRAVLNFFSRICQMFADCFRFRSREYTRTYPVVMPPSVEELVAPPVEPKKPSSEALRAPYKVLPDASPGFEKKALELAKENLNPQEIEDIENFLDPNTFVRIIIRAVAFSGKAPTGYFYEYYRLKNEFEALPEPDKVAIINHFDSTCKKTDQGHFLIPENPKDGPRKFIPKEAKISEQAAVWWQKLGAAIYEAGKMDTPIMIAIAKALGHEGVQAADGVNEESDEDDYDFIIRESSIYASQYNPRFGLRQSNEPYDDRE